MSPIKDLSEVVRLPRIGKIHLGYKHPEKGYPIKTDYFVFDRAHPQYQELVKLFGDPNGKPEQRPRELRIFIPVEDEEIWANQYYRAYSQARGLICKGDGEQAIRMVDTATGDLANNKTQTIKMADITCEGTECPTFKAANCKRVMQLRFVIPELAGLGVWQIDTSSINGILNINSAAKIIKRTLGRISLVPLLLTLEADLKGGKLENGKRSTIYVLNLRTRTTVRELAEQAREQERLLLVAPSVEKQMFGVDEVEDLWDGDAPATEVKVQAPATVVKGESTADQDSDELKGEGKTVTESKDITPAQKTPRNETATSERGDPIGDAARKMMAAEAVSQATSPTFEQIEGVDTKWLREALDELGWVNVKLWFDKHYPEARGNTVRENLAAMTMKHRNDFCAEVERRLTAKDASTGRG